MAESERGQLTVGDALRQIDKLCKLESEGVRVIYFRGIIENAVAAEREACARIADDHSSHNEPYDYGHEIAAKIRARATEKR